MIASLFAALSLAQTATPPTPAPAPLPCDGSFVTYRINDVKPGMQAVYEQAVHDQNSYYAAHGNDTRTVAAKVIEVGQAARRPFYSTAVMATVTTYADFASLRTLPHDASYAKFIAEYQQSSTIRSETRLCVPAR